MSVTVTVNGQSGPSITATNGDTIGITVSPAGAPGGTGSQGPAGPANTLTIGTVSSGSPAAATITGTAPNQVLNLTIPGSSGVSWVSVPASATASGTAGQVAYDGSYLYVCTATNTWVRSSLATWSSGGGGGGGGGGSASTVLLLNFESSTTPWEDSSSAGRTITPGSYMEPTVDTMSAGVLGSMGAAVFSGASDSYLTAASSSDFDWSTGDAVIECWIRPTDLSNTAAICNTQPSSGGQLSLAVSPAGGIYLTYSSAILNSSTAVISTGSWVHVAAVKSGSNTHIYANGVRVATSGSFSWPSGAAVLRIGSAANSASLFIGKIDSFRIRRGTDGGYTGSTITVPTSPFSS